MRCGYAIFAGCTVRAVKLSACFGLCQGGVDGISKLVCIQLVIAQGINQCFNNNALCRRQGLVGNVGGQVVHDVRHSHLAGSNSVNERLVGLDVCNNLGHLVKSGIITVQRRIDAVRKTLQRNAEVIVGSFVRIMLGHSGR